MYPRGPICPYTSQCKPSRCGPGVWSHPGVVLECGPGVSFHVGHEAQGRLGYRGLARAGVPGLPWLPLKAQTQWLGTSIESTYNIILYTGCMLQTALLLATRLLLRGQLASAVQCSTTPVLCHAQQALVKFTQRTVLHTSCSQGMRHSHQGCASTKDPALAGVAL